MKRLLLGLVAVAAVVAAAALLTTGGPRPGTVQAATPTPTPTPTFAFPSAVFTFVNNTGQTINDLHIVAHGSGGQLQSNAPGCPDPSVSVAGFPWPLFEISLNWSQLCVDPGESVAVRIFSDCFSCGPPPAPISHTWTVNGTPVGGSGPTPTPTATPTPPPTPTPTPTPTSTPAFPPVRVVTVPIVNDTGRAASDLHISVFPPSSVSLSQNAPGCPAPSFSGGGAAFDVIWPSACVDPGESVTFQFGCSCVAPEPYVSWSWTFPTPTPSPAPTPVGGTTELLVDGSDAPTQVPSETGPPVPYAAIASGAAAAVVAIASGWYARRRWLR